MKQQPRSEADYDEGCYGTDNMYVVDEIVCHIGSKPHTRCVVRLYRFGKADDTDELLGHIPLHFIGVYWRRLDKQRSRRP